MRLTCPACGATQSLDVAIAHHAAREALMVAFACPAPLGPLLTRYLGLFRSPGRALSFDRVERLLGELLPMLQAGRVERHGRAWAAPQDVWRAALEQMINGADKLTLPLKSHGYLLEIIAGMANRGEAAIEARRESARAGSTPIAAPVVTTQAPAAPVPPVASPAARQAGLKSMKAVLGTVKGLKP